MNRTDLAFVSPWSIEHPTVIRYLPTEHVESFFRDGSLRLSTFRCFRKNPDEVQGDVLEGRVTAELQGLNVRHAIQVWNGQAAFVLCGTLVESEAMEVAFKSKSRIRIRDVVRFADLVSRHMPGFVGGMQGNCVYRDEAVLRKPISEHFEPPKQGEDMEAWGAKYDQFVGRQIREGFLIKRSKYAAQNEYRLIWFARGVESQDALFVKCPEAAELCDRVVVE